MQMRAPIFAVLVLAGCEHIDHVDRVDRVDSPMQVEPVVVAPAVAPKPPTILPPDLAENRFVVEPSTRVIEDRRDGLPNPLTDEPKQYAAWFAELPRATQRKINSVCRRSPRSYQYVCGGIGHLHIPYPPFMRAREHQPTDPTIWLSDQDWEPSLTAAQKRYIDRMCRGGEDQPSSDLCGDNTPLVVAFDDEPIRFTPDAGSFAFAPGRADATDWPAATTPWIVHDRDGNGSIDSGAELFGDHTPLASGRATNGFTALAALDANHDGVIDARDPAFATLQLWADADGDQRSSRSELRTLSETIVSISLTARIETRCDARGNCEGERAAITWRDASGSLRTGAVVDVYLPRR